MVPDAKRVRHRRQGRVHRADAREEARVDDVEVVHLVGPAVGVEHRRGGIGPKPDGPCLVRTPGHRNLGLHVGEAVDQVARVHVQLPEDRLHLPVEPLPGLGVGLRVAERDLAVTVDGDAVVGAGQILGREPEVDRVSRDPLERPLGRELRLEGLLAAEHRRLGLADHLDVPQRELEVVAPEVEVVQPEGLLIDGRVLLAREREHGLAVVEHEVAPHLVGAVREPVGVGVVRRLEQELRRVRRAAGDDDEPAGEGLLLTVALDDDAGDLRAGRVRLQLHHARVDEQRDVRVLERRAHADHLGVGLGVEDAGEAVAVGAAHAGAVRRVRLVEQDPARRVERPVAGFGQVVRELLDAGLVRDGRMRVVAARVRLGRVLAPGAVHLVELLGLRVVGLELVVGDRPRRRDAVVVPELAEVLPAQAVEGGPVELGRAPDEVVHLGLERLAARVVPGLRRDVAVLDEHVLREPVLRLAGEPPTPLQQQDPLSGGSEAVGERSAPGAAPDDDHVVGVTHDSSSIISAMTMRPAASISARCEKACGKLPRCRAVLVSNSSA